MRTRILLLIKTGRIYQEDLRGSCPARPLRRLTLPCWTGDGLAGDNFDGRLPTPITRGRDATTDFTCSRFERSAADDPGQPDVFTTLHPKEKERQCGQDRGTGRRD